MSERPTEREPEKPKKPRKKPRPSGLDERFHQQHTFKSTSEATAKKQKVAEAPMKQAKLGNDGTILGAPQTGQSRIQSTLPSSSSNAIQAPTAQQSESEEEQSSSPPASPRDDTNEERAPATQAPTVIPHGGHTQQAGNGEDDAPEEEETDSGTAIMVWLHDPTKTMHDNSAYLRVTDLLGQCSCTTLGGNSTRANDLLGIALIEERQNHEGETIWEATLRFFDDLDLLTTPAHRAHYEEVSNALSTYFEVLDRQNTMDVLAALRSNDTAAQKLTVAQRKAKIQERASHVYLNTEPANFNPTHEDLARFLAKIAQRREGDVPAKLRHALKELQKWVATEPVPTTALLNKLHILGFLRQKPAVGNGYISFFAPRKLAPLLLWVNQFHNPENPEQYARLVTRELQKDYHPDNLLHVSLTRQRRTWGLGCKQWIDKFLEHTNISFEAIQVSPPTKRVRSLLIAVSSTVQAQLAEKSVEIPFGSTAVTTVSFELKRSNQGSSTVPATK